MGWGLSCTPVWFEGEEIVESSVTGHLLGLTVTSRRTFKVPTWCLLQWDDETDMAKMEECVRSVQMDGLVWGASKLVPVGYGIKKLQIQCVVEDDKVGTDILEEEITKFEDYVSLFVRHLSHRVTSKTLTSLGFE